MSTVTREDVIGRIITLQSKRYDGHYAKCDQSYKLHITGCEYTAVPNALWTRLLVHEGPDGTILLESVRYRNYYVDAHHSGEIHLTHALNPPTSSVWARWRMVNVSDVDVIALESDRYSGSYLDAHHSMTCRVTDGKPNAIWAQWRIAIGPGQGMKDGYEAVASFKNDLDKPAKYKYKHCIGTTVTETTTTTLTAELSREVSANFKKGPIQIGTKTTLKFAAQWSRAGSSTWSTSTEIEAQVAVPAGKKVRVNQLQGTYGPLKVHSNDFSFSYE